MNSFFNSIIELDEIILNFLNIKLSNPLFDFLMPIIDKPVGFILPVLFFWIYLIIKNPLKRIHLLILIPVVIGITDQVGYKIKKMELRDRPWVTHEEINHLGGNGGKHYSFPSNHASNSMAIAVMFFSILGMRYRFLFIFAFIAGFSRIYIGVHYPGDVLCGFVLGGFVARIVFLATNKLLSNWGGYRQAS